MQDVQNLIHEHLDKLNNGEINQPLENVFFDRHLYQPLLAKYPNEDKTPSCRTESRRESIH